MSLAGVLISLLQLLALAGLLYTYMLLVAAWRKPRRSASVEPAAAPARLHKFAIAIPAHDEAAVLPKTLSQLQQQTYPASHFDIYVVADYCTDATAQVALQHGARGLERNSGPRGRKAYAVQWLIQQLLDSGDEADALVIFDSDSRVDPEFLHTMNAALQQGYRVLQGQHIILAPEQGRFSGFAAVDMRLNNLLRNQAKHHLGLSARLMGDAMVFSLDIIRKYGWPTESLVEDRQYGLYLVTQGERVAYIPEAKSYGQAAPGWRTASRQRLRWYGGAGEIRRQFAPLLLREGLKGHNWAALDLAVELLLPSFTWLTLLTVLILGVGYLFALPTLLPVWAVAAMALAWIAFPFLGLWISGAPKKLYLALLLGPVYVLWRIWVGLSAALRGKKVTWVRTQRQEELERHD